MIELKNVSFSYHQGVAKTGLKNVNLSISKGEIVLLCGESGCGKTSLTRLINGLIPHYFEGDFSGEITINGRVSNDLSLYDISETVGSVFQNPRSQFFCVDTTSEMAFGCENKGLPVQEITERIQKSVAELKISDLLGRNIFKLSGGEKQKVACASVSACSPEIMVLDEPSSNLDTVTIDELRKLIYLWKSQGKTIIIAEHRIYYLRDLVDRLIYVKEGRIDKEFDSDQMKALSLQKLTEMGLRPLDLDSVDIACPAAGDSDGKLKLSEFFFSYRQGKKGQTRQALRIPELDLPEGAIIAVTGKNGAGKTTLSRCVCGLEKRCRGHLEFSGKRLNRGKRLRRCYLVMQDVNHQLFTESVLDEVILSIRSTSGMDSNRKVAIAEEILDSLSLLELKDLHPLSLSGGQKQRVAIASALASGREIIFFDEPTSGLDLKHMMEVSKNLRMLQENGKTLFVVSHDIELILSTCTHVLHLESGRVADFYALDGTSKDRLKASFEV